MDQRILEFDWIDAIRSFKRWWKRYAMIMAAALAAAAGLSIWTKPTYRATVSLLPAQSKDSRVNRLEAIASKFGLDSPVPGTNFADFLEPIVESKTFLLRLAGIQVQDVDGKRKRAWDTFKYPGESPDLDSLVYLARMRTMVLFRKKASGMIEISITAPTPDMAAALANESVRLINGFNQEYSYSNARANVTFLTEQMANAEGQKARVAANLVDFLERNRGIDPTTSPSLYSQFSNLKVEQEIANQKYLLIRNQLESARLNLERKEPLLTVLDYASRPYFKYAPKRKEIFLIFAAAGFMLAAVLHLSTLVLLPVARMIRAETRKKE